MSMIDTRATNHTRKRYNLIAPAYDIMGSLAESGRYQAWRESLWQKVKGPEILEPGARSYRPLADRRSHCAADSGERATSWLDG